MAERGARAAAARLTVRFVDTGAQNIPANLKSPQGSAYTAGPGSCGSDSRTLSCHANEVVVISKWERKKMKQLLFNFLWSLQFVSLAGK